MIFGLLSSSLFPCPRTHKLHLKKLASGFVQEGLNLIEIKQIKNILNMAEQDVLYISNHFSVDILHKPFNKKLETLLYRTLLNTTCKIVFWNFHTTNNFDLWKVFGDRSIHMGENINFDYISKQKNLYEFRNIYQVYNLRYSSPYERVDLNFNKRSFDFQFVGSRYKVNFLDHVKENYNSFIRKTPPIVNEVLRVNSFQNSLINLVFHSNANIEKGIIVERFSEALSLGGIIFHDHPLINKEFKALESVVFINSIEDLEREYMKIINMNAEQVNKLRKDSRRAWEESELSYKKQAKNILNILKG
jgi:hypothetical protein